MRLPILSRPRPLTPEQKNALCATAVKVARDPKLLATIPERDRLRVDELAKALTNAQKAFPVRAGNSFANRPVSAQQIAHHAASGLAPETNVVPADIEHALREQGLDFVQPFSPGTPLQPYYGYDRRPRDYDYRIGRNISTETRPDRLPFAVLKQVVEGYDVAQICIRHIINDIRSMKLEIRPMEGYEGDVKKEVAEARRFLRRPDGLQPWETWLAEWMMDVLRYDAGCLYKARDRSGKLVSLQVIDGTTIAPELDWFGGRPTPPAPAFQQFIQGVPWDWLTTDEIIYYPQWPLPESPYGVAPIETILINANTDVRLQLFFLQFFTEGAVPEMLLEAPVDESDPDSLADWQELWDDWFQGNQAGRHGARFIPSGSKPFIYKPQQFDPKLAEYVIRRTVAAFGLVPNDLGFTDQVNRATSDTQMDVQFRIGTLPNTQYYEAILDEVIQDELGLPVATHFDTGREKEDRLMEAQAHQIYVSIGAESPDEVRRDVLDLPVENDFMVPRFFDSRRLGPIPISYLESVSGGHIDPSALAPQRGTVEQQQFVSAYGMRENISQSPVEEKPAAGHVNPQTPHEDVHDTGHEHANNRQRNAGLGTPGRSKKESDLAKWKANARKRVAKGQRPRMFAGGDIPDDVFAVVWSRLEKATTKEQVDQAFAEAGDVGPKAWSAQPRDRRGTWRTSDQLLYAKFHRHTDDIVDHYAPQVADAMAALLNPVGLERAVSAAYQTSGLSVQKADWRSLLQAARRPLDALRALIARLWGDAYMQGAHEAADAAEGSMPPWTVTVTVPEGYWENWTPGVGRAAASLANGGLADLLRELDMWVKEMSDTQVNRIGDAVAEGIRQGMPMKETLDAVEAIVGDRKRAWLIAETEYARAQGRAQMETYRLNNVPELRWMAEPTACAKCKANEAASPQPTSHPAWPFGPIPVHPHERCAVAPAIAVPNRRSP